MMRKSIITRRTVRTNVLVLLKKEGFIADAFFTVIMKMP
jgi:hypothetical protein